MGGEKYFEGILTYHGLIDLLSVDERVQAGNEGIKMVAIRTTW